MKKKRGKHEGEEEKRKIIQIEKKTKRKISYAFDVCSRLEWMLQTDDECRMNFYFSHHFSLFIFAYLIILRSTANDEMPFFSSSSYLFFVAIILVDKLKFLFVVFLLFRSPVFSAISFFLSSSFFSYHYFVYLILFSFSSFSFFKWKIKCK